MQPLQYQSATAETRKAIVLKIARGFKGINEYRFPKIATTLQSGNNKKNQLLELVIAQMYSNDLDLESSFLAVEENI